MANIKTQYLIIGNSAAGIGAVQGIRASDRKGKILILSDEPHHTYSRPLISYWLEGRVAPEHMLYRDASFYDDYGVEAILGDSGRVVDIDPEERRVTLADGNTVDYESCVIAAGSVPFVPPMEGVDAAKNAYTFTKFDDAKAIREVVDELAEEGRKPEVVILGAGLIGLKAAEALHDQAESITVVDLADRILPSVLTEGTSPVMQDYLEEQGLVFRLGRSIAKVDGAGDEKSVTLSDGEVLPYDLLILAAGTRPNTVLAAEAGIDCGRGILTDERQQTSQEGIYAAGDCTDSFDMTTGQVRNMAILPNAFVQGRVAGSNMASGDEGEIFEKAFPLNSLGVLGLYMLSAGAYDGDEQIIENEECVKHFFVKDNKLNGYIIFGDCPRAGIYTSLIRDQIDLDSVDAKRLFGQAGLMGFPKSERYAKLSQAH